MAPYLALRPCRQAGCPNLVKRGDGNGYCPDHVKKRNQNYNKHFRDPRSKQFYGGSRWKSVRKRHLSKFPLCADCLDKGISKAGEEVHHNGPYHNFDPSIFYDPSLLLTLCKRCHSKRTASDFRGNDK